MIYTESENREKTCGGPPIQTAETKRVVGIRIGPMKRMDLCNVVFG